MIDATLLFDSTTVYSPWFPRQADMLRVVAECVAINNATIVIDLYTKNSEDPGDGNPVDEDVSITMSGVGRSAATEWKTVVDEKGVQQLLRFRYEVTGNGGHPTEWILFRLLPAVWFDAVSA
jgi:hypothetical protein